MSCRTTHKIMSEGKQVSRKPWTAGTVRAREVKSDSERKGKSKDENETENRSERTGSSTRR